MTKTPVSNAEEEIALVEKQLKALRRQQAALRARDDLITFAKYMSPDPEDPSDVTKSLYENALHHDAIAAALQEVERGNFQILILTVPPRHGKSRLASNFFPAWYLGRNPRNSTILSTYSDEFAMDFGAEVRRIMTSPLYKQVFPHITLTRGGAAKDRLQTTQGGMAFFVGVGGATTGRGGHVVMVDDALKDYEQARSQAHRDRVFDWFSKVLMTRRMGPKSAVITMTRWHADDLVGRLTDPENEHYSRALAEKIKIIDLPAIAGEDDPLGRVPGAPLWPDRYDLDFLEEQRMLDPLGFEALYQQRPSLADGDLFRRDTIQYFNPGEIDERDLRIFCASDHAVATGQRSDYTVLLRVGVDKQHNIYLLDCWWQKKPTDVVVEAMLQMLRQEPKPLVWWAEKGHITKSIGPFLRKRMFEEGVFGNIVEVTPVADKAQRAQSIAARAAMGKVFFPKGRPWVEKAINELLAFPNGLHDDFVDALSYIGLGLQSQIPVKRADSGQKEPKYGTLAWVKDQQRRAERATINLGGF